MTNSQKIAEEITNSVIGVMRNRGYFLDVNTRHAVDAVIATQIGNICKGEQWDTLPRRKNCWLGTSIADQEDADRNIPLLLKCRDLSPVLFVSAEPLLEDCILGLDRFTCQKCGGITRTEFAHCPFCNFRMHDAPGYGHGIDWVIAGGESGPKARPMHPAWARSLRDQCQAAGVPFFFKQWGEWAERTHGTRRDLPIRYGNETVYMSPLGKEIAGRVLDGREWSEFPKCGAT